MEDKITWDSIGDLQEHIGDILDEIERRTGCHALIAFGVVDGETIKSGVCMTRKLESHAADQIMASCVYQSVKHFGEINDLTPAQ